MFVKPTDTHQFLDPTSSHAYHCKKGITYSQALRLNSICSDNENFDERCNDLQHSRNNLLEREKSQLSEQKLTSNITYYQIVWAIMEELHILLTPNKEYKKVFPNVPVIGFRNGKSLKDFLVKAI